MLNIFLFYTIGPRITKFGMELHVVDLSYKQSPLQRKKNEQMCKVQAGFEPTLLPLSKREFSLMQLFFI